MGANLGTGPNSDLLSDDRVGTHLNRWMELSAAVDNRCGMNQSSSQGVASASQEWKWMHIIISEQGISSHFWGSLSRGRGGVNYGEHEFPLTDQLTLDFGSPLHFSKAQALNRQ
jgi:hypothetical protein